MPILVVYEKELSFQHYSLKMLPKSQRYRPPNNTSGAKVHQEMRRDGVELVNQIRQRQEEEKMVN